MKLPYFHDSDIIGLSIQRDNLVITFKLDLGCNKKEIFTFYLQDCKNAKYWYDHLKKYDFDGVHYKGHHYNPPSVDNLKLKRNELVIYPHIDRKLTKKEIDEYKEFFGIRTKYSCVYGTYGSKKSGRLPNPPQYKKNRVIRIKFKNVITS